MATKNYGRGAKIEKKIKMRIGRFRNRGKERGNPRRSEMRSFRFFSWTIPYRREIDNSLIAKSPGNMSTSNKYMNKILQR